MRMGRLTAGAIALLATLTATGALANGGEMTPDGLAPGQTWTATHIDGEAVEPVATLVFDNVARMADGFVVADAMIGACNPLRGMLAAQGGDAKIEIAPNRPMTAKHCTKLVRASDGEAGPSWREISTTAIDNKLVAAALRADGLRRESGRLILEIAGRPAAVLILRADE